MILPLENPARAALEETRNAWKHGSLGLRHGSRLSSDTDGVALVETADRTPHPPTTIPWTVGNARRSGRRQNMAMWWHGQRCQQRLRYGISGVSLLLTVFIILYHTITRKLALTTRCTTCVCRDNVATSTCTDARERACAMPTRVSLYVHRPRPISFAALAPRRPNPGAHAR
jgi:hypothetical protein